MFCNSTRDTDLQANFYLNKKNRNTTELKGNVTFKIPFDDSLFVSSSNINTFINISKFIININVIYLSVMYLFWFPITNKNGNNSMKKFG